MVTPMNEAADGTSGPGASFAGLPIAWEHTGDGELPYRATVDGAPYTCDVFAYFADPPDGQATAESLLFRRQVSRPVG
jgi:hypothetical protein